MIDRWMDGWVDWLILILWYDMIYVRCLLACFIFVFLFLPVFIHWHISFPHFSMNCMTHETGRWAPKLKHIIYSKGNHTFFVVKSQFLWVQPPLLVLKSPNFGRCNDDGTAAVPLCSLAQDMSSASEVQDKWWDCPVFFASAKPSPVFWWQLLGENFFRGW